MNYKVNYLCYGIYVLIIISLVIFFTYGSGEIEQIITLEENKIHLSAGDNYNLKYNILPKNATDKSVSFISANNEIVNVDNNAHDLVKT